MAGVNKVMLLGHLGEDPELKISAGPVPVVSFSLATSEYINKGGARIEHTEWHNIVMRQGLAESAARVLKKGQLIYIEGKCTTRAFDDKEGIRRYVTEIAAVSFTMMGHAGDFEEFDDRQNEAVAS